MDPDVAPPLPDELRRFRAIVNEFKRTILEKLDDRPREDVQYLQNVKDVTERIHHLGTILLTILKGTVPAEPDAAEQVQPIQTKFREMGLDLGGLSRDLRDDCIYYVKNDIFTAPYDLNTAHIDAVRSFS